MLVAALEVELPDIGARGHGAFAKFNFIKTVGNHLPDSLVTLQIVTRLIDIAKLHCVTNGECTSVRCLAAGNHPEQRCLAGPVRTDDANNSARGQPE